MLYLILLSSILYFYLFLFIYLFFFQVTRTSWELELDISAPQIIFVEQFTDHNSSMAVIDFGRLQLRNNIGKVDPPVKPEFITKESEEDGKCHYLDFLCRCNKSVCRNVCHSLFDTSRERS